MSKHTSNEVGWWSGKVSSEEPKDAGIGSKDSSAQSILGDKRSRCVAALWHCPFRYIPYIEQVSFHFNGDRKSFLNSQRDTLDTAAETLIKNKICCLPSC